GVNETESGDLIYNNLFEVPVPAITPTVDPYQCAQFGYCFPLNYTDSWNVSRAPATATRVVNGFTLTGSIIGTSYQGGNSWSNYGTTANPFGVLPYNDSGFITRGGDFVPLVPFSVYPVTFDETGLATGAPWNVTADGILAASVTSSVGLQLPNGTYSLMVGGPAAYGISAPAFFTVSGAASVVSVTFVPLVSLTVKSSGLGVDAEWSASINGTGTGNATVTQSGDTATIVFEVTPGTYNVTAAATAYTVSPRYIQSSVGSSGASVTFTFSVAPGRLALKVTPTTASVYVNGALVSLTSGALTENLSAGLNSVEATASGYAPYFNNVSVSPQSTLYLNISLVSVSTAPSSTSSGLSSTWLAVLVGLGLLALIFLIGMVYFARRRPPPSPQPWPGGAQYPPPPPS
ncbi:MAG TPA: PEGA domain-containing protein, partial [Thermoplasmata archaeon]|nr:PEGA domain-containing protein [Thermoplasmata archaeon]